MVAVFAGLVIPWSQNQRIRNRMPFKRENFTQSLRMRASLEVKPSLSKSRSLKWDNSNKVCRACVKVVI